MRQRETDYEKAKKLNLTSKDRWFQGIGHHPLSERLMRFLRKHDREDYNDSFQWKTGGDGDNGETLMFQMDAFFELMDKRRDWGDEEVQKWLGKAV